ncbi:hypothetical protein J2S17_003768 [Cytobacillus purgationiresistens]|uniref:Transposase n=2 Tax=Cytobacillus purgationiresistens TaxID=863449 RepID=A0ABU0AP95_9BACI|nr:hypothetical protein [Cytobacillus purgationiresistens]
MEEDIKIYKRAKRERPIELISEKLKRYKQIVNGLKNGEGIYGISKEKREDLPKKEGLNKNPNIKGISRHAKEKTEVAYQKVDKAIKDLINEKEMINFNHVSNKSGVSKSFLYNHSELRDRIEHLRKQQIGLKSAKQLKKKPLTHQKMLLLLP